MIGPMMVMVINLQYYSQYLKLFWTIQTIWVGKNLFISIFSYSGLGKTFLFTLHPGNILRMFASFEELPAIFIDITEASGQRIRDTLGIPTQENRDHIKDPYFDPVCNGRKTTVSQNHFLMLWRWMIAGCEHGYGIIECNNAQKSCNM